MNARPWAHALRRGSGVGIALAVLVAAAPAQEPAAVTAHDLATNPAYERRVMFGRLQTELVYVDRLDGDLPLDGLAPPPVNLEAPDPETVDILRWVNRLGLVLLIAGAAVLVYRNRRWLMERFGASPAAPAPKTAARAAAEPAATGTIPNLIADLRGRPDREAALVELIEAALATAARVNGLRLGTSETARDLLRRLPSGWRHRDRLRQLVMTEELVQFGGRPLPEATFFACLDEAVPIFADGAAR